MKFSIIICTYNVDSSISKTLESILAQDFKDFEVIVVDGKSTDNTIKLIKSYEEQFEEKLKFISEEDSGIYDAMNKGIKIAKGEWLYFLGSGDIFYDNNVLDKLNKEIILLKDHDIIYGNVEMGNTGLIYDGKFTIKKLIKKNISHQAIIFNKNIFNLLGFFNAKYKSLADWEFNMRWFNNKKIKVKYIDVTIAKYDLTGMSKSFFDKLFYDDFENNVKKYFPKKYFSFFKKEKFLELFFAKNKFLWNMWLWKNKLNFLIKSPNHFAKKYFKSKKNL